MSHPTTVCRFAALLIAMVITLVGAAAHAAPLFTDLTPSASVSVTDFYGGFPGSNVQDADFFGSEWITGNPISNQAIATYNWSSTEHVGYVLLSGSPDGRTSVSESMQVQYSVDGSTNWTNIGSALTPAATSQNLFYVPVDENAKAVRVVMNNATANLSLSGFYAYGNSSLAQAGMMDTTTNLFSQATQTHTGTWEMEGTAFSALADTSVDGSNVVHADAYAAGGPPTMLLTYAQDETLSGLALANDSWYYSGGMIYGMHIDALNQGVDPDDATAGDWTTVWTYSDATDNGIAKLISAQFDSPVTTRELRLVITDVSDTVDNPDRAGGLISEVDVIGGDVPEPASLGLLVVGSAVLLRRRRA